MIDFNDWAARFVQRWAELSKGQYDSHAAWDDAGVLFRMDPLAEPELVAERAWKGEINWTSPPPSA